MSRGGVRTVEQEHESARPQEQGLEEGGVGGNLRATEASSSCQVQASTQGRTIFLTAV